MVERDQVRPLAPAADAPTSDDGEAALQLKKVRRKKLIRCCACSAAFFIILAVVIVVLIFTVFRVKDPIIKLNAVSLTNLDLTNATTGSNISLTADVSVKNPNIASFKYRNTTTTLYYYGAEVGDARGPGGTAKARRTILMNITVDIMTGRLLASPNLTADLTSGTLTMISYSRIGGRVNMLNIIKKHVTVMMNCTVTVNITSQAIQEQKCKQKNGPLTYVDFPDSPQRL